MEDTTASVQLTPNTFSDAQLQEIFPQQNNNLKNIILIIGGLVLLGVVGMGGYYLGSHNDKNNNSSDNRFVTTSPSPSTEGVACTMEAKICPDGSSVGRSGPNCEFMTCPSDKTAQSDWKMFLASNSFPGEFKVPPKTYTAGKITQDGNYYIFISNNPIIIPESWDSPFTPVDIRVVDKVTSNDNYAKKVEEAKGSYLEETLVVQPITAGPRQGVILTGTFGDGYAGGERVAQAFFETNTGYIHADYYPFVDKGFSEDLFKEIMVTFNLK